MKTDVKKDTERVLTYENRIRIVIYKFETLKKSTYKPRKSNHLCRQKLNLKHHESLIIEVAGIKGFSLEMQEPTCSLISFIAKTFIDFSIQPTSLEP